MSGHRGLLPRRRRGLPPGAKNGSAAALGHMDLHMTGGDMNATDLTSQRPLDVAWHMQIGLTLLVLRTLALRNWWLHAVVRESSLARA